MSTPYIGFSNETLSACPAVGVGDFIDCPKCGGRHALTGADDGSTLVLFFRCGTFSYLGAINGRSVVARKADVAGIIDDSTLHTERGDK